jgi:sodium/bile acid cotransporter 7
MFATLRQHVFLLGLFLAIGLAIFYPQFGAAGGILHSEVSTKVGVGVIFFLLGASTPLRQLLAGLRPLRLHGFVCGWNYLCFPVITGLTLLVAAPIIPEGFTLGLWLCAIMPTTIASAVAFTDLAGGDAPNAIFATMLSNVLAVFVVPACAVVFLSVHSATSIPFWPLFLKIVVLVLMPLIAGQVLRRCSQSVAQALQRPRKFISSLIILFIVHVAFANSMQSESLRQLSFSDLFSVVVAMLLLLVIVSALAWWTSGYFRFNRGQKIAAFYCASQKSLATGLPLIAMVMASVPELGDPAFLVIPLIAYHPTQLILAGVLAKRWSLPSS